MNEETALLAAIAEGDDAARLAYADLLEERGDARAAWVRDVRVWRWMEPDARDPLPGLFAALGDVDYERRAGAVAALAVVGAAAVPELMQRVEAGGCYGSVAWHAAEALGWMRAEEIAPVAARLVELAASEADDVRRPAILGLQGAGAAALPALPSLIAAVEWWRDHVASGVALSATRTIANLGPQAVAALPALLAAGVEVRHAREYIRPALAATADASRLFRSVGETGEDADVFWAAEALTALGPDAVPTLREAVAGGGRCRYLAALALSAHDPEAAMPALVDGLTEFAGHRGSFDSLFAAAIRRTGSAAAGVADRLRELLLRLGWGARDEVAQLLATVGAAAAREHALAMLERGEDRDAALHALSRLGDLPGRILPVVLDCLDDRDNARDSALSVLSAMYRQTSRSAIRARLPDLIAHPSDYVARYAVSEFAEPTVDRAVILACLRHPCQTIRDRATVLLGGRDDMAAEFVALSRDPDPGIRVTAAWRMGDSGPMTPEVAAAIRDLLISEDGDSQTAAWRAVAIRGPAAVGVAGRVAEIYSHEAYCFYLDVVPDLGLPPGQAAAMLRLDLADDVVEPVVEAAAHTLGVLGRRHGGEVVIDALPDLLRMISIAEAADTLAAVGAAAVPGLVAALDSPCTRTRENAARALARIGVPAPEAETQLRRMLWAARDEEVEAAMVALGSLGVNKAREDLARLTGGGRLPAVALWAAARLGAGVSVLRRCLDSPDDAVRSLAAVELARVNAGPPPSLRDIFTASAVAAARDALLDDIAQRDDADILEVAASFARTGEGAQRGFAFTALGRFGQRDRDAAVAVIAETLFTDAVEPLYALARLGPGLRVAHAEVIERMGYGGVAVRVAGVAALRAWLAPFGRGVTT